MVKEKFGKLLDKTNERVFIDEAFDNGRKINKLKHNFLLEVDGGDSFLDKLKKDKNIPIYLTGKAMTGDSPNRNYRIYPWEHLKKAAIEYMNNDIKQNLAYGELDHPEDSATPSLNNSSHTIEDLWFKGKDIYVKIKVLNAFMPENAPGLKVRGFLLNGKNIGISLRSLGSIEEYSNSEYDVVADDLEFICWDFVSKASNFGSEKMSVVDNEDKVVSHEKRKLIKESVLWKNKEIVNNEKSLHNLSEDDKVMINIIGLENFVRHIIH